MIVVFFGILFVPSFAFGQIGESLEGNFINDPVQFFSADGRGVQFLFFIGGVAIYAIFVFYFYRFISRREIIPAWYLKKDTKEISNLGLIGYIAAYTTLFPIILFVWFFVLGYFIFIVAQNMPLHLAFFISMAVIGVVRIISYFKEEASKEVAKMIPFAILSFFLTSTAIYTDPNFIEPEELLSGVTHFTQNPTLVLPYVAIVVIFEWIFRVIFMTKRKFLPVTESKLEEQIQNDIDERVRIQLKKINDQKDSIQKHLEEEKHELAKLKEERKRISDELKNDKGSKINDH